MFKHGLRFQCVKKKSLERRSYHISEKYIDIYFIKYIKSIYIYIKIYIYVEKYLMYQTKIS